MGLQVRIYEDGNILEIHQNTEFTPDPVELVLNEIYSNHNTVDYYDKHKPFVFGSIKTKDCKNTIIIGPTFSIKPGREQLLILMKELGIPFSNLHSFITYTDSIPTYSMESLLQILSFINYAVNNEKITALDMIKQNLNIAPVDIYQNEQATAEPDDVSIHNTINLEKKLVSYIKDGKTNELHKMFSSPPSGRVGKLAHNELRQMRNTFICSATLASRAAIDGGLSYETAFTMSDHYIQKVEMLPDYNSIALLNIDMLIDFAERVEGMHVEGIHSKQLLNIIRYINSNINQKILIDDITRHFGISRVKLCNMFRSELDTTFHVFITKQKMDEAKRLLKNTDRSLSEVSEFLGFSSQSHFQNTFRKHVGITPVEYRKRS